jgi:hypothetical protein
MKCWARTGKASSVEFIAPRVSAARVSGIGPGISVKRSDRRPLSTLRMSRRRGSERFRAAEMIEGCSAS